MRFLLLILILCSCSKESIDRDRELYVGTWEIEDNFVVQSQIDPTISYTRPLSLHLNSDGTAREKNLLSCIIRDLEWFYQSDPQNLIFIDDLVGANKFTEIFDVVEVVNNDSIVMFSTLIQPTLGDTLLLENTRIMRRN